MLYFYIDLATYSMIGRKQEAEIIQSLLNSEQSELLAVVGRRRIGKTYLVRETLDTKIDFELIGLKEGSLSVQLQNFQIQLARVFPTYAINPIKNWLEAFDILSNCLESNQKSKKSVLFFDEFPWLNAPNRDLKLRSLIFGIDMLHAIKC